MTRYRVSVISNGRIRAVFYNVERANLEATVAFAAKIAVDPPEPTTITIEAET